MRVKFFDNTKDYYIYAESKREACKKAEAKYMEENNISKKNDGYVSSEIK